MKKKTLIIYFVFIFIYFLFHIIEKPFTNLDELWQYNFARSIADGLIPYNDFNIITPPFIYFLPALVLNIFGTELLVMRIFTVVVYTGISYIIYLVLKELFTNQKKILLIHLPLTMYISILHIFDYNFSTILVSLIALLLEIKLLKKDNIFSTNFKSNFLIGLTVGSIITIKHTVGLLIVIASLGYKLLLVTNKLELKKYSKIFLYRFMGCIIPVILLLLYLLINNNLMSFIDYTILGIKHFTVVVPYTSIFTTDNIIINIVMLPLAIIVPVMIVYSIVKGLQRKNRNIHNYINIMFFAYGVTTFILVYPLTDMPHFIYASIIALISIGYNINYFLKKRKTKIKLDYKLILISMISIISFKTIYASYNYFFLCYKSDINNYKNITVEKKIEDQLILVVNYIKEQESLENKVYILDSTSIYYTLPLDIYTKHNDTYNIGNLGSKGEEGEIEKIKQSDNKSIYLIYKYNREGKIEYSQRTFKVIDYVTENLTKTGQIGDFDIYIKE